VAVTSAQRLTTSYWFVASLTVGYAILVFLLWMGALYADVYPISGRAWTIVAWLWLIWPIALAFHPARSLSRVAIPVAIGLAFLAPCIPVLWDYTAWLYEGIIR
jgi:hypothetical protein